MDIESLGTIRSDRFPGLNFPADGEKLGREGYIEKKHESGNAVELHTVKWMDNRGVETMVRKKEINEKGFSTQVF